MVFIAAAVYAAPTLHLVGDSTMADKPKEPANPETGWGQALPLLLRPEAVRAVNYAMNGRSTKSFIDEGRWAAVVAALRPGDFVIIQFAHNDEKDQDPKRYAAPRSISFALPASRGSVSPRVPAFPAQSVADCLDRLRAPGRRRQVCRPSRRYGQIG